MKSVMKKSVLLILVAFAAVSCGKYEEGPEFSLLPKSMRVINNWVLSEQYVDGEKQNLSDEDKNDVTSIQKDGKMEYIYTFGTVSVTGTGTWEFGDSKETLKTDYTLSGVNYSGEYTILRLTSNELWLEKTTTILGTDIVTEYHYVTEE